MDRAGITVRETSGVAGARRRAVAVAAGAHFSEEQAGRVALIATEAATNLLRHADGGEILSAAVSRDGVEGVEIIALDQGPGIANLGQALRDGYSTIGGAGTGLGAIARLASEYDVYTAPGKGTALVARVFPQSVPPRAAPVGCLESGGISVPVAGETECGDAFRVRLDPGGAWVVLSDGLGHGPGAAEASRGALAVFDDHAGVEIGDLMDRIHGALRSTRGAAVALSRVSTEDGTIRFASVGNVAGTVLDGNNGVRQMVAVPGTLGHEVHKVRMFSYDFRPGSLAVLYSDGIVSRWSLDPYPGLMARDPSLIAGVVYRDFKRGRDDASVVVLRYPCNGSAGV